MSSTTFGPSTRTPQGGRKKIINSFTPPSFLNMDIKLIKLYRGSFYLPQLVPNNRNLSFRAEAQDIKSWWSEASPKFKETVLSERKETEYGPADEYIEAVGVIIEQLNDVTIFSHQWEDRLNKHTSPQVIASSDIIEIVSIKEAPKRVEIGSMVKVAWVDASHNITPLTTEEASSGWKGTIELTQFGFLIHQNEQRVMIGGRYLDRTKQYKFVQAIPTSCVRSMVCLGAN